MQNVSKRREIKALKLQNYRQHYFENVDPLIEVDARLIADVFDTSLHCHIES